jgi:hypothetical protein
MCEIQIQFFHPLMITHLLSDDLQSLVLCYLFQQKEIMPTLDLCINLTQKITSPFSVKFLSRIASTSDGTSILLQQTDPDLTNSRYFIGVIISIFPSFEPKIVCEVWNKSSLLMNKHLNRLIEVINKIFKVSQLIPFVKLITSTVTTQKLVANFQKQHF